jgi:hypothetical protein
MWPYFNRWDLKPSLGISAAEAGFPGLDMICRSAGAKITVAIKTALGPDILMIPIPPWPPGVAMAAIVELSIGLGSLGSILE